MAPENTELTHGACADRLRLATTKLGGAKLKVNFAYEGTVGSSDPAAGRRVGRGTVGRSGHPSRVGRRERLREGRSVGIDSRSHPRARGRVGRSDHMSNFTSQSTCPLGSDTTYPPVTQHMNNSVSAVRARASSDVRSAPPPPPGSVGRAARVGTDGCAACKAGRSVGCPDPKILLAALRAAGRSVGGGESETL